jgi:hypothetical protein
VAPAGLKRCAACRGSKPLSEFWRSAKSKDGLQARCKACQEIRDATPRRRRGRSKHCEACYGMPHARPPGGCPPPPMGCGLPYEAEKRPPGPERRF